MRARIELPNSPRDVIERVERIERIERIERVERSVTTNDP
jgi:hypothetical protein